MKNKTVMRIAGTLGSAAGTATIAVLVYFAGIGWGSSDPLRVIIIMLSLTIIYDRWKIEGLEASVKKTEKFNTTTK